MFQFELLSGMIFKYFWDTKRPIAVVCYVVIPSKSMCTIISWEMRSQRALVTDWNWRSVEWHKYTLFCSTIHIGMSVLVESQPSTVLHSLTLAHNPIRRGRSCCMAWQCATHSSKVKGTNERTTQRYQQTIYERNKRNATISKWTKICASIYSQLLSIEEVAHKKARYNDSKFDHSNNKSTAHGSLFPLLRPLSVLVRVCALVSFIGINKNAHCTVWYVHRCRLICIGAYTTLRIACNVPFIPQTYLQICVLLMVLPRRFFLSAHSIARSSPRRLSFGCETITIFHVTVFSHESNRIQYISLLFLWNRHRYQFNNSRTIGVFFFLKFQHESNMMDISRNILYIYVWNALFHFTFIIFFLFIHLKRVKMCSHFLSEFDFSTLMDYCCSKMYVHMWAGMCVSVCTRDRQQFRNFFCFDSTFLSVCCILNFKWTRILNWPPTRVWCDFKLFVSGLNGIDGNGNDNNGDEIHLPFTRNDIKGRSNAGNTTCVHEKCVKFGIGSVCVCLCAMCCVQNGNGRSMKINNF